MWPAPSSAATSWSNFSTAAVSASEAAAPAGAGSFAATAAFTLRAISMTFAWSSRGSDTGCLGAHERRRCHRRIVRRPEIVAIEGILAGRCSGPLGIAGPGNRQEARLVGHGADLRRKPRHGVISRFPGPDRLGRAQCDGLEKDARTVLQPLGQRTLVAGPHLPHQRHGNAGHDEDYQHDHEHRELQDKPGATVQPSFSSRFPVRHATAFSPRAA